MFRIPCAFIRIEEIDIRQFLRRHFQCLKSTIFLLFLAVDM